MATPRSAAPNQPCALPALQIFLLTHATEFLKATNTGALVAAALAPAVMTCLEQSSGLCQPAVGTPPDPKHPQAYEPPQDYELPQDYESPQASEQRPEIQVTRLAWSRVAADPQILAQAEHLMLLYPTPEAMVLNADVAPSPLLGGASSEEVVAERAMPSLAKIRGVVILDATWQLAHKMYRQSPYLQQMPSLLLQSNEPSVYALRRNQRQQGWCTAESVALLLKGLGYIDAAARVSAAFLAFNQRQG